MARTLLNKKLFLSLSLLLLWAFCFSQPKANFAAQTISGCAPLTVNFQDLSTGNPTAWQWNLGNGTLSNKQSPSTSYFTAGTYTVTLKINNSAGSDSLTKVQFIAVYSNPTVNFSAPDTVGCFPLRTSFTDLSTSGSGNLASWYWDLGDGNTSSLSNPLHKYTVAGNYSVTLKVTNSNGCSKVLTKAQYIKISNGVTVGFTNSAATHCTGPETINFSNTSTGPSPLTYKWDFGDGSSSIDSAPAHIYNAGGTYSVSLVTNSVAGCFDTLVKQNIITIRNYQTNFSGPDSICVGVTAHFNNISVPAPTSSFWDFGDGTDSALMNVTKQWNKAATYQLKLVNNYGVCVDSILKAISVIAPLTGNFTCTDSVNCKAPFITQFKDLTVGSKSWQWDFGDGTSSILQNPSHTYTTSGQFKVTLTVTNVLGCTTTVVKNQYINILRPNATIAGLPLGGCIPFTYNAIANINDPKGIAKYLWDFGDGNSSNLSSPSHIYPNTGTYTIKLYFTTNDGCTDSIIENAALKTGTPPTVNFTANNISPCAGQSIQFTDLSGSADSWKWNFGDLSNYSTEQNPQHQYLTNGTFNITLLITNSGCTASITKNNFIKALPPVANFTPVIDCSNKTKVSFKDVSVLPQSWSWDFGDGITSNLQNPMHNYPALGNYKITLTVQNGICSESKTVAIKLVNEHADFSIPKDSVCVNAPVTFTAINSIAANISSYTFDFGDGTIANSTSKAIIHGYANPGTYSVKLIITDINGCKDSLTKTSYVTAIGPVANFTASPTIGCKGLNVTFTDNSTADSKHPIINWQWDYGDSITQSLVGPPFSHTFNNSGTFVVKLKITDSNGCFDTTSSTASPITITDPLVNFNSADTLACSGKNILFNNASSGSKLTYLWTLGNGNSSTDINPVTTYIPIGNYNVKLVATDINGCSDSLEKDNYISVQVPKANFTIKDSVGYCLPFEVNFINTSINSASQTWDFGDGSSSSLKNPIHYYSTPGTYIATLYATRAGGCVDSFKRTIIVHPSLFSLTYTPLSGCSEIKINFHVSNSALANYFWDFGDGNTLSTSDSNIVNTYQSAGSFVPKVIITDSAGCQTPLTGKDTIHLTKSIVNFKAADSTVCLGTSIVFFNNTTGNAPIQSYHWDFGDGTTSSLQKPTHLYLKTGIYSVMLIANTINGCSDTLLKNNYINVYGPVVNFSISTTKGCKNKSDIIFIDSTITDGIHPITNWQWDFGDGVVENFESAPFNHIYTSASLFTPKLKVTDTYGCTSSYTNKSSILVTAPKAAFTSNDTITCIGSNVHFINNSSGNSLTYAWALGNNILSNASSPIISYATANIYSINLIATDNNGCSDTLTKNNFIKVNVVPKASINVNSSSCVSSLIDFSGVWINPDTSTVSWHWDFGNGNKSSLQNPLSQQYKTAGSFPVTLIISSAIGCADTVTNIETIHPLPIVNAGSNKNVCLGNNLQLQVTGADNYSWSPSDYLNCTSCSNPITTPLNTTAYHITGNTIYGCQSTDSIIITVKKPFKVTVASATDTLCQGKSVRLEATGAEEYTWIPSDGLNYSFVNNPIASPVSNTTYKVIGTDNANCYTDSAIIAVAVFPYPTVYAGPDKNIMFGQSATLTPQYSNDVIKWEWEPATGLSCTDCAAPVAITQISTTYSITVTNAGGCTSKDNVAVYFPCQMSIFIPNTFSPNNDGMNDYFYPRGKDISNIQSFTIYDRWGEIVFRRTNFPANSASEGWDGRFKGQPATSDVYTYIIEVVCNNNSVSAFKGDITLIR